VNTAAARYQNLSINQTKLSGQCGRLKCCLNYELDTYLDALQGFPENADMLRIARGTATLIKKDIFRNLMWYVLPDSNKQYPVTIERVKKIRSLNNQNIIPDELEAVDLVSMKDKEVEPEFVDVVGHITLKSLEKADKKRRDRGREQQRNQPQKGGGQQRNLPPQRSNQQQRPQGQQGQQQRPPQNPQQQRPQGQQRPPQQRQNPQQGNNPQNRPNQQRPPFNKRPPEQKPPSSGDNDPKV
jgi:hypothetical protein